MTCIQVGIVPDTPEARDCISRLLGWHFDAREDGGVWQVLTAQPWPDDQTLDLTLVTPNQEEIAVSVEWP